MKVYVFCHNAIQHPSGGLKVLFEMAEAIKASGYDTNVLIPGKNLYPEENPPNWKPNWFDTSIVTIDDVDVITSEDIVLIHEEAVWAFEVLTKNKPRYIMVNQGAQSSLCTSVNFEQTKKIYNNALGVICVSRYIALCLEQIFKVHATKIHVVKTAIADYFFDNAPDNQKENIIAIMDKQRTMSSEMTTRIIYESFPAWRKVMVSGLTHRQMADLLNKSKIFVFFAGTSGEGSPLPPVEAAAAGCKVIGSTGMGGSEDFIFPNFLDIEYNDVVGYNFEVHQAVRTLENTTLMQHDEEARNVRQKIRETRSLEAFNANMSSIFKEIIGG